MVRDPCIALFARLNWFCRATWLLGYGGSVRLPGCSGKVVLSFNLAASRSLVLSAFLAASHFWFCPLFWLLGLSGSFRLAGCSLGVFLSAFVAALFNWFGPLLWLLVLTGSVILAGCSVVMIPSSILAALLNWFFPHIWLLSGYSIYVVLSWAVAAHAFWFQSRSLAALWLLGRDGSIAHPGCSVVVVHSLRLAAPRFGFTP